MPAGQMPIGGATVPVLEYYTYTRAGLPELWSAHCQGRRQHMTEHKRHTLNPRTEIKIPDLAGNGTRAARRVGRQGLYRVRHGDGPIH